MRLSTQKNDSNRDDTSMVDSEMTVAGQTEVQRTYPLSARSGRLAPRTSRRVNVRSGRYNTSVLLPSYIAPPGYRQNHTISLDAQKSLFHDNSGQSKSIDESFIVPPLNFVEDLVIAPQEHLLRGRSKFLLLRPDAHRQKKKPHSLFKIVCFFLHFSRILPSNN
jgi:hypothetical protein